VEIIWDSLAGSRRVGEPTRGRETLARYSDDMLQFMSFDEASTLSFI
jgi:hypothetical protein